MAYACGVMTETRKPLPPASISAYLRDLVERAARRAQPRAIHRRRRGAGQGAGTITASRPPPPQGGKSERPSGEDRQRGAAPEAARAAAVIGHAAAQTMRRLPSEPPACSYEAEIRGIVARFAQAIDEARRSTKPRHEIEAIIRGIRAQQANELAAARRRRKEQARRLPLLVFFPRQPTRLHAAENSIVRRLKAEIR